MAAPQLVGQPVEVVREERPVEVGTEVKYQHYGSVLVADRHADGSYSLEIPGVGLRRVSPEDFEYMVVSLDVKIDNVNYTSLAADDARRAKFESAVKQAVAAEASALSPSDVAVMLYRSSARSRRRWHGAVLARVTATPPTGAHAEVAGTTAGALHLALTSSPSLPDRLSAGCASAAAREEAGHSEPITAEVSTVTVTPHRTPLPGPELYPREPHFYCWYYNEDDPRSVLFGRDALLCEQPGLTPNTATLKGRCLFPLIIPCALALFPCRALIP